MDIILPFFTALQIKNILLLQTNCLEFHRIFQVFKSELLTFSVMALTYCFYVICKVLHRQKYKLEEIVQMQIFG